MALSLGKSFTKSEAGDALMMRQLSPEDRATIKSAQSRRQQILQAFRTMPKTSRPADLKSAMQDFRLGRIREALLGH
jgi:hypothetical protein